jgi:glycosyltransferase involved in cell wall biosynthesis
MGRNGDAFLDQLISQHPQLRARVHATGGMKPELLSAVLQACDVVVQWYGDGASSRRGTLMAPLAHGLPIVTTEGRLSERVWRESGSVRLVNPSKPEDAARAVVELCDDPAERTRLGHAARTLYANRFDLSHTIAALVGGTCQAA